MSTDKQEDIKGKINDLRAQVQDFESKYKRARADYINLERRTKEEREALSAFIKKLVIIEVLPVFDDLAGAAEHNEGSALVLKKFKGILENMGVEEIQTEGKAFDPERHEAVEMVEGEKDKVVEIIASGFTIDNEVIRPAKVKVGRGKLNG